MGKRKVYLAGLISTMHPETLEWRLKARRDLKEKYEVLDPLRGKEKIYYGHDSAADQSNGMRSNVMSDRLLMQRDYAQVGDADVLLVNLFDYGGYRPLTGTIYELGWAWEQRTPILAFCPPDYWIREHCFVRETVSGWFENEDEAIRHLLEVF